MIQLTLKGNPRSTQWAYAQSGKIRFMKKEAKQLKDSYILQTKIQYKGPIIKDIIEIQIKLYFGDKRVRDWDNYHKLSMDALSGIIFEDDSQIKKAIVEVMGIDKLNPRIELVITEIQT